MGYPNGNKDATALIDAPLRDNPALYPSKRDHEPPLSAGNPAPAA
ncbi:hypothetical protein ACPA9J_21985 [Pseudomonas aeruginosa]